MYTYTLVGTLLCFIRWTVFNKSYICTFYKDFLPRKGFVCLTVMRVVVQKTILCTIWQVFLHLQIFIVLCYPEFSIIIIIIINIISQYYYYYYYYYYNFYYLYLASFDTLWQNLISFKACGELTITMISSWDILLCLLEKDC